MSFLKKMYKKLGPEPAGTPSERMVMVHVGDGEPQFDLVFVLPASHLTRPRLAPLVAMAEDDHQGQGDMIRIRCDLGDFVDAMVWTSVEEAEQGRLACGRVVAPAVAPIRYKLRSTFDLEPLSEDHIRARQAMLIWMLDPGSCDPAIFDLALTGDSDDLEAAADVFTSRTPEQLATLRQNCKKTSSSAEAVATRRTKKSKSKSAPAVPTKTIAAKAWGQKISELLRVVPNGTKVTTPEPAETSSEKFVTVHVGEGQLDRVFVLPASHLTRPRLAPLVAMAVDGQHGDVIRIQCRLSDFAEAVARTAIEEADEGRTACGRVVATSSVADKYYKHRAHPGQVQPLSARHIEAQQELLRCIGDPASTDASIRDAAAEVINSRTPAQPDQILRENGKKSSSWDQRISKLLHMTKPAPETPPPPSPITFRPTWARNRRMSAPIS
ncbi:hypothetical protein EJB05_12500, partial [Eragrostis curvula]